MRFLRQSKILKHYGKIEIWQLLKRHQWNVVEMNLPKQIQVIFVFLSILHFVLWDLPSLAALEGVPVCQQQWYQGGSVFRLIAALRTWLWSLTFLISFGWLLFTEIHFDLSSCFVSSFAHLAKLAYCMYWRKEGPLVENCSQIFFF